MPDILTEPEVASPDWRRVREDFPILDQTVKGRPLIYFDNAATSQKPRAVIDALVAFYERDNANVHRGLHELSARATALYEGARSEVASFIGAASPEEIVFTRGTTEAINLVARAWGGHFLREGDVILLTELEHHSNLVPWQMAARRTGARLRFLPVDRDGVPQLSALAGLLTPEVRVVAVTHISNALGAILPVREICAAARKVGAFSMVDAAQSVGHVPVDVGEIDCDFLAFSGHKSCGPTGIGVLYGKADVLEGMPPWQGGGEMILRVEPEASTFKPPPHRFEAGTPPIAEAAGLAAALRYLRGIGLESIAARDEALTAHADERLRGIPGLRLLGPALPRGPVCSFLLEGIHPHDLVTFADEAGLALRGGHHCAQPLMRRLGVAGTVRASLYFYNTHDEIDAMADIIHSARRFFGV